MLEGLRGEEFIAALCRREGIAESLYYNWSKEFLEAGKKRLAGDTARAATSDEVKAAAPRDPRSEGGRRRTGAGTAAAQKKHDRGWGRRRMRYPASEKLEIIRLVEQSHLPVRRTLEKLGIPRATFYRWYDRFLTGGVEALEDRRPRPERVWNRIPDEVRDRIIELALDRPELSPRELAVALHRHRKLFRLGGFGLSPAQGPRPDHQPGLHRHQGRRCVQGQDHGPNQLWQTDFTYLKVIGWGWFYLSTILDDFSRYIIAWKLCTTMRAEDVTDTLNLALAHRAATGAGSSTAAAALRQRLVLHRRRPRRMALGQGIDHVRGAPGHPQTQGKIERWHQTLKNRILLENYFLPGDLEAQIAAFVEHYNHRRYHESLDNLTPADVYFGRGHTILLQRERIKRQTINQRRLLHRNAVA